MSVEFTKDGFPDTAHGSKLKAEYKFSPSEYYYIDQAGVAEGDYLRGTFSTATVNALGMNRANSYWGRATKEAGWGDDYGLYRYKSSGSTSASVLPLVKKSYGLLPKDAILPARDLYDPVLTVGSKRQYVYLLYNPGADACYYSLDVNDLADPYSGGSNWTKINNGPGIFFAMCGGGGGGASGHNPGWPHIGNGHAGGGGGGGATLFGYIDLRAMSEFNHSTYGRITCVYVEIGSGGTGGQESKDNGTAGGSTKICSFMPKALGPIDQSALGGQWLYSAHGGGGGIYDGIGGAGGVITKRSGEAFGSQFIQWFGDCSNTHTNPIVHTYCNGKKGGDASDSSGHSGESFSSGHKIAFWPYGTPNWIASAGADRGNGKSYSHPSGYTTYGGGGGASLLYNYGNGGTGGASKSDAHGSGEDGDSGVFIIYNVQ